MTDITKGRFNVQLMNELKIDFATIGNNEGIGLAKNWLNHVYQDADFKVILGNLEDENGRPDWAEPYQIYETKAGTRIAFLAYTFPYYLTYKPGDKEWIEKVVSDGRSLLRKESVKEFDTELTLEQSCQLVMDAMKDYARADVAMINSGLVVEAFGREVTKDTLHHSLPHQMRLARLEVTTSELEEICQDVYSQAELLAKQQIRGMGFRGKEFGTVLTSGFDYKNGKIVYNEKVTNKKDTVSLILVDQYYFARYFESIKSHQAELLFPELLRELVEDYLKHKE
jgi:2',3'-cyclic-nucleotide 2'-phosphodiesterase (5'-nucleotidase family)